MAIINPVTETLHRIRVKLYPGYLPHTRGKFIARTDDEACLSVRQVCASARDRGGFPGKSEVMEQYVKMYHEEAAYLLANGFAINTGWYTIHPKIRGVFEQAEGVDPTKSADLKAHKVEFAFRALAPLRALAAKIELVIEGIADVQGYIGECVDISSGAANETLTPGGMIALRGHKIKVMGDDPDVGLYFISAAGAEVKAAGRLAENTRSKVIGRIPALTPGPWKIAVRTQYSGATNTPLQSPRTILSACTLTVS